MNGDQAPNNPVVLFNPQRMRQVHRSVKGRHTRERLFRWFCVTVACSSVVLLVVILGAIVAQGMTRLTGTFLTAPPSPNVDEAGFFPPIMGSLWLLVLTAVFTLPLGVGAAIMLEEFKPRSRAIRATRSFIQTNITNLAGVPSVVYGIVGLTAFASMFGFFGNELSPTWEIGVTYYDQFYNEADRVLLVPVDGPQAPQSQGKSGMTALVDGQEVQVNVIGIDAPWPDDEEVAQRTLRQGDLPGRISESRRYYFRLPFGRSVLTGALTLMLVILPVVIIASQESLRAVPASLRDAALGLGATRWQVVWNVTLPAAIPGIMTGAILAMSRAIGEAAPLLMIAGIVFISNPPGNLMDDFTAMPLQTYNWAQRPQREFHDLAASSIIVLLTVLLCFNATAVLIRQKFQKPLS
ncbi:MAG: PstA family ABC transporter permease [Phycisphaeraceae bacterium]